MSYKIDHLGIAVDNLNSILETLDKAFGLKPDFIEEVVGQAVRIAGFRMNNLTLEYFEPLKADSPIANFLAKRGNGIHHIAIEVENLENKLTELLNNGFDLIDHTPRQGAQNKNIAFLHPRSFNGILIELSETKKEQTTNDEC